MNDQMTTTLKQMTQEERRRCLFRVCKMLKAIGFYYRNKPGVTCKSWQNLLAKHFARHPERRKQSWNARRP